MWRIPIVKGYDIDDESAKKKKKRLVRQVGKPGASMSQKPKEKFLEGETSQQGQRDQKY